MCTLKRLKRAKLIQWGHPEMNGALTNNMYIGKIII